MFRRQAGTIGEQGLIMPALLPPSSEYLERHGLYLIEDGQTIFLWVGRDAVPQLVLDVFDLPSYGDLRGGKVCRFRSTSRLTHLYYLLLTQRKPRVQFHCSITRSPSA